MNEFYKEYDLNLKKADNIFETALDALSINVLGILQNKNAYINESVDIEALIIEEGAKFMDAIKAFFQKLIDSIKKLCHDVSVKFAIEMRNRQVNARLKELKKELAKYHLGSEKIKGFDARAYNKAYTQYINFVVPMYRKLYSKEYENMEEYNKLHDECNAAVDKKMTELGLDKEDAFIIDLNISNAISYTEQEVNSMNSIIRAQEKAVDDFIKEMENKALNTSNSSIVSNIKADASRLVSNASQAIKKVVDAPIHKLSSIMSKLPKKKSKESDGEE